ncbi:DUF58 domain-containing protein [Novacetimonas hansenii]|uniref:DUF58 domain-containing protein n=2 Tax=Novacetimonas hansenii TaxID=436 RepID=A0ABQ0SBU3_NOVHA|nr:DUF58 domain-containing protein [Novacetimonas hansenii]EFG83668.1 hypothetical protein GXY_12823 [Novacetimonas hansenii ATCC 23769]GAN83358.1 hypothetical protein Gaha_0074_008 [Novacetimonas hansenii JCM 7643]GEC62654.1 hypothetical protein GHA01_05030 [Novacetimonas hansenii]
MGNTPGHGVGDTVGKSATVGTTTSAVLPSGILPSGLSMATQDGPALARALAARMPALIMTARRIAQAVQQGGHARRRAGSGENFWQYRPAQPGEAASRIDWRQSARGERPFVRENEAQTAQTIFIWCDNSSSMNWHSSDTLPTKAESALVLALALAAMLLRQGERVRLLGADGATVTAISGNGGLERMSIVLIDAMRRPSPPATLPQAGHLARNGRLVLLGDGLYDPAAFSGLLRAALARQVRTSLIEVIDPAERDMPYAGRTRFMGLEDEAPLTLSAGTDLRTAYRAAFTQHQQQLSDLCRAGGNAMITQTTDQPPERALLALHAQLAAAHHTGGGMRA